MIIFLTKYSISDCVYYTRMTVGYLSDRRRVQKIADDRIAHFQRRTDTGILRSLEVRIANTQKDMEDTTTAYIQAVAANNGLFVKSCEKRMSELAALSEDLKEQHLRLEIERGDCPTYQKIFAFVDDLLGGDVNDKAYQKRIIDNIVNCVFVSDKRTVIFFNFDSGEVPFVSKAETDAAIDEIEKEPACESSGSVETGRGDRIRTCNQWFWRPLLYR